MRVPSSLWTSNMMFAPLLFQNPYHRTEMFRLLGVASSTFAPGPENLRREPAVARLFAHLARSLFLPSGELARHVARALAPLGGPCDVGLHLRVTTNTYAEARDRVMGETVHGTRLYAAAPGSRLAALFLLHVQSRASVARQPDGGQRHTHRGHRRTDGQPDVGRRGRVQRVHRHLGAEPQQVAGRRLLLDVWPHAALL